jgi:hypothetical protein
VLRRIFGPEREEVAGGWRRLHNEELHNLFTSQNIIWVMEQRRIRWAGQAARMREISSAYEILVGTLEGKKDHRMDLDVDGKILEFIFGK